MMIHGNNCKLSESPQKLPEKRVSPKQQQKSKALTEKTKFTLQYNTVNSQTEEEWEEKGNKNGKNGNKKIIKSDPYQQCQIFRSDLANSTEVHYTRRNISKDQEIPLLAPSDNQGNISSLPFFTTSSRISTNSHITEKRMTKICMKTPKNSKKSLIPIKSEFKRSTDFHNQTCPSPNRTELKTASGKTGPVKKSRYSPSGMMPKDTEKSKRTPSSTWKCEGCYKSMGSPADLKKHENVRPGVSGRERGKNVEEDRKMAKERSRSQEIERITKPPLKQSDEINRSDGEIVFNSLKKSTSDLGLRDRNRETRSVALYFQEKSKPQDSSSPAHYSLSKDCTVAAKQNLNTTYDPAICYFGSPECKANVIGITDQNSNNLDIQSYSSIAVEDAYLSLEPMERIRRDEELLSLDKKMWNNLEEQIRETCEKTDILCDTGDDSGESLSEIMHQTYSNPDDEAIMGCLEASVVRTELPNQNSRVEWDRLSMESKKFRCQYFEVGKAGSESKSKDLLERSKSRRTIEGILSKKTSQDSKRTKSSETPPKNDFKQEFRTKSLGGDTKLDNLREDTLIKAPKERKTVNFLDDYKCGSKTDGLSFFQAHKNVGFIGKEADEEYVSFEPDKVTLYQPHESHMLLYDIANCAATQGYLNMCGISYNIAIRKNAEQMSPSGRVPFICSNLCIIPEFEAIVSFLQYRKFASVPVQDADQPAFYSIISMIVDILETAERYICWYDNATLLNYTRPRIKGQYPFPLNHIMHWKKKQEEKSRLMESGYSGKSTDLILDEIRSCFRTLSRRLGNNNFFFGNVGTEVDALVYGHVYALFTTEVEGPLRDLQFIVQQYPNLVSFACNFDKTFSLNKFPSLELSYWDNILTEGRYPSETSFSCHS